MIRQWHYKAKDESGKTVVGLIESVDKDNVIRALRAKHLLILSIVEEKETELDRLLRQLQKVKSGDVVNFTRQLSTMIQAGLPLTEALRILQLQSSPAMGRVVSDVLHEVEGGSTLAAALEKDNKTFPQIYIALVKAGESAGVMDVVLERLALNLEKDRDFKNKTKGALVYPAIVTVGMLAVVMIMMIFVVPKMTDMYKDFGADLPLPTRILIGMSDFMVKFWYVVIGGAVAGVVGFRKWVSTEVGGVMWEEFLFKLPILGMLKKKVILTEFTRTMGMLVASGISILDALKIVADAVGSRILKARVMEAAGKIEKGQPLSTVLVNMEEFPPIVPQMLAVGEQTGKVDEILTKLSTYFEQEAELGVKTMTTAIEPLIMVVMGLGVGFLVMAVIMPIYNLTNQF